MDKYKIQIGDTLYQASTSYKKVFEWKILGIWLEEYLNGFKTIVRCSNGIWAQEFFASDVLDMYRTKEDAENALAEKESRQ